MLLTFANINPLTQIIMKGKKVYVYIKDVANDYDHDTFVELYESKNDAIAQLAKDRAEVIGYWKDEAAYAEIDDDTATWFCACEDGYYARNHDHFYIVEREIK